MTVAWVVLAISLLADVVSLIGSVRDLRPESRRRRFAWASALVILTGLVVYQGISIRNYTETRNEARALVSSWPKIDHLEFSSKGELIGTVLAGLQFLEHHRAEYPETYLAAQSLVHNRLNDFHTPQDSGASLAEYGPLKDGAGAMIQLFHSIAGNDQ
jgi:hypothetical protein